MAPCLHILLTWSHITLCNEHGSGYGSMDLDIITYMDLDMAPCPHITTQSGYGSMSTYLLLSIYYPLLVDPDMDMSPSLHIIIHMDMDMSPCMHIIADPDMERTPCPHIIAVMDMDMTPCLHICHFKFIIPY